MQACSHLYLAFVQAIDKLLGHAQVNEVLEASLMQLQQRNNPHAEAVAAALNRTGSADRPAGSLLMPSSPLRARAAEAAGISQGLTTTLRPSSMLQCQVIPGCK